MAFHRQEACTRCSLHGPLRGVGKSSSRHSGDDSTATSLWLPERRALMFFGASSQCFRSNVFDPMVRSKQTAQFIFSSELKSIKRQPTAFLTLKVPVFCLLPSYPPVVFPTPPTLRKYLGLWVQSEPLGASSKETWSKLEPAKSKMHRQGRRRDKQSTKIRMIWDGMNRRYITCSVYPRRSLIGFMIWDLQQSHVLQLVTLQGSNFLPIGYSNFLEWPSTHTPC